MVAGTVEQLLPPNDLVLRLEAQSEGVPDIRRQ
jgi:hypothetical protein